MPSITFWMEDIGHWSPLDPTNPFKNALGGRETATIRTAQELAKLGWSVTVACPLEESFGARANVGTEGIYYVESQAWERDVANWPDMLPDVLVSVEHPSVFKKHRGKLNILHHQCAHVHNQDRVGRLDSKIDHYFLLSSYQRWSMVNSDRGIDPLKCVTFGNGIDLERFEGHVEKVPGRLVWSSSLDRGLHHLIRMWPALKEKLPHLSLKVFYKLTAMDSYKWTAEIRAEWARTVEEGKNLPGIEFVGPVDQKTLAREQMAAELFAYPCDPVLQTETYCITALENMAARTPCLLSNADCLEELYGNYAWFARCPVADNEWIAAIELLLTTPERLHQHVERARQFAEERTWANIAKRWDAFLRRRLELTDQEDIYELVEDASGAFASVR